MFEQGAGRLSVAGSFRKLLDYSPRASAFPPSLDLTKCPYFWPYCSQPLYAGAQPTTLNVTILNGMGVVGEITEVAWVGGLNGDKLTLSFSFEPLLWPWSGWLGIRIAILPVAAAFTGLMEGLISVTIKSPPGRNERADRESTLEIPLRVAVVPTPSRERRLLWDQYHNLRYPPGFFPKDALSLKNDPFDAHGDHPHTNFRSLFQALQLAGYSLEVLSEPLTCFDASQYGALLLVDPEEEFFPEEVTAD